MTRDRNGPEYVESGERESYIERAPASPGKEGGVRPESEDSPMGTPEEVYFIDEDQVRRPIKPGRPAVSPDPENRPRRLARPGSEAQNSSSRRWGSPRALIASILSLGLCGAGQAFNGQWQLALLLFLSEALAVVGHWSLVQLWPVITDLGYVFAISEWEIFLFVATADFLLVFFLLYNIAQAYRRAEAEGRVFAGLHQPVLSAVASILVPGLGQLLNAQLGKALFFFFCLLSEIYVVTLLTVSPLLGLLAELELDLLVTRRVTWLGMGCVFFAMMMWVLSAYDAFLVAHYRRRMR